MFLNGSGAYKYTPFLAGPLPIDHILAEMQAVVFSLQMHNIASKSHRSLCKSRLTVACIVWTVKAARFYKWMVKPSLRRCYEQNTNQLDKIDTAAASLQFPPNIQSYSRCYTPGNSTPETCRVQVNAIIVARV